jgi:hypothetical protein
MVVVFFGQATFNDLLFVVDLSDKKTMKIKIKRKTNL